MDPAIGEKSVDKMKKAELQVREMIDKIPILAWSCRPDGAAEFLNDGSTIRVSRRKRSLVGGGQPQFIPKI